MNLLITYCEISNLLINYKSDSSLYREWLNVAIHVYNNGSVMPEVRGKAEPHGETYPPPSPHPRTPSRHSSLPRYGSAGIDGRVNVD